NLGFAPKVDDEPRMPRFQSTVVMTVTKVTQAMLDEVLSSAGSSDEATDEVEVSENPAVEAEAEESEVEIEVTSPSAKMAELAKVLKHLDGQIEILGAAGKAKDAEITRLQLELRTVQQQNGELERELAELRAAPIDPETASILDKYRDIK
ncbi:MAG: hypothetical protein JWM07_558, partial [Candidatus Saccharibacteria bacterium]|nr:hypothetical protein [Candidatus Saccharibacteria bacterium]